MSKIAKIVTSNKKSETFLVVGKKGTGKTTFVLNKKTNKSLTVYVSDRYKSDFYDDELILNVDDFLKIVDTLQNCKIVLDDCRNYIVSNSKEYKAVEKLLINSRHLNNELYLIFHSLNEIPERYFSKIDYIILFKTNSDLEKINFYNLNLRDKLLFANEELNKSENIHAFKILDI